MWSRSGYPLVASRDEHGSENSQRSSPEASGMPPNQALQPTPSDAFFLQFTHLSAAVAKLHLVRPG
jgi:hypothetical protein